MEESIADVAGFYRIKLDEAAIILARLHGFKWSESGSITVNSKFFENCKFWSDGAKEETEDDKIEGMKKTLILNTRFVPVHAGFATFNYQARMYPLSSFTLPTNLQKVIDSTENLNSLNDCAFFDYYWVLVPSLGIDTTLIQRQKDHWTICEKGVETIYTNPSDAAFALDKYLVTEGAVAPIVIGERDGKCYFVSMFI